MGSENECFSSTNALSLSPGNQAIHGILQIVNVMFVSVVREIEFVLYFVLMNLV